MLHVETNFLTVLLYFSAPEDWNATTHGSHASNYLTILSNLETRLDKLFILVRLGTPGKLLLTGGINSHLLKSEKKKKV